jgi:type VI secretion system protein ImpJ
MSGNDKIVWSEGLFLQPQHFQQHDHYWERLLEGRVAGLSGYGWGFGKLEVDLTALGLGKVRLTEACGIFPDGTPFDFPGEDSPPPPIDIDIHAHDEQIVLALPLRQIGTMETAFQGSRDDGLARYVAEEITLKDLNSQSGNEALIQVGRLRLKLMNASDVTDAYTTLGVAQVLERRADNQVLLNKSYIPPMIHALGNATLAGYVRELHGVLHQRAEVLAARVSHPGRGGVADVADFLMLQTVNRYEPLFAHGAIHPTFHPERLYTSCLQLAGDLATFSHDTRRPPSFPEYRHDALEQCFTPLMADLRRSLSMEFKANAVPIELQDRKYGVRVATISDPGLLKTHSFVLAVNAQMPAESLRTRFPTQVKIGPVEAIRNLVNLQLPGIPLRALPVAPRQIPFHAGFSYFELERGGELWKQLDRSGGLAMHIAGEFPGLELEFWAIGQ